MNPGKRQYWAMVLMGALFVALPVLAWLQYRWIGEAARAEIDRGRSALRRSAEQLAAEFDHELSRLHQTVVAGPEPDDHNRRYYSDRLAEWKSLTSHSELCARLYLSEGGEAGLDALFELDETRGFHRVSWPSNLIALRAELVDRATGPPAPPERRGPPGANLDVIVLVAPRITRSQAPLLAQPRPEFRPDDGPPPTRDGPPPPGPRPGPPPPRPGQDGWVIAVIDRDYIRVTWAPELVRRYFAPQDGTAYDVRIISRANGTVVFESDPPAPAAAFTTPDAEAQLFATRPGPPAFRPRAQGPAPGRWVVQARDRSGGVESVAARNRARNLAVSGAVLLIMAVSLAALWLSIRRSADLAARQMQFVASVSHELRTPLAVIRSAAENLADGVVSAPDSVKEYGSLIRDEGRRLSNLVEQTLRFAGIQTGRARYNLTPMNIRAAIDDALRNCDGTFRTAGCAVETHIDSDLPPVLGDAAALTVAIANLLTNAARHGKSGGWIGVAATREGACVRIEVQDRGPGVDARDLPHLFEPFYRGGRAALDQVSGAGLGLALVSQSVTAHRGDVSVCSKPGSGASFTMTIPAAAGCEPA